MSTTPAFWTLRIWSRRSNINVATEHFLVAEIRDAGADGASGGGAARLRCDPVPDQRNPLQQSRGKRATGVFGLYRYGVQKSEVFAAGLPYDQRRQSRRAGSIRELFLLFPFCLRGSHRGFRRPARMGGFLRLRPEAASAVPVREEQRRAGLSR